MRYVEAKYVEKQETKAYRIYITDALRISVENYAKRFGGSVLNRRYEDIVYNRVKADNRSGAEIIEDLTAKLRKAGGNCEPC